MSMGTVWLACVCPHCGQAHWFATTPARCIPYEGPPLNRRVLRCKDCVKKQLGTPSFDMLWRLIVKWEAEAGPYPLPPPPVP